MDCIELELSNQTIVINIKTDEVRQKSREVIKIKSDGHTKIISAKPAVITEFMRRIEGAREDRKIDCKDLHGKISA